MIDVAYVFVMALCIALLVAYTQVRDSRPVKVERVKDLWAWTLNAKWTRWN